MAIGDPAGSDLNEYLSALRRRKGVVILTVVVALLSALALSLRQAKVYEAHARVLLTSRLLLPSQRGGSQILGASVDTEIQVMQSQPVVDAAKKKLGVTPAPSITQVGSTAVVEATIRSTSPVRAAQLVNGYVDAYIGYRLKQAVDQLQTTGKELQDRIDSLQKRIDELGARLGSLPPCSGPNPPANACDQRSSVLRDRDSLVTQQVPLKQQLDQLQVDLNLKDPGVELVAPAVVPTSPVEPKPVRNGLLALGLGFLIGVAMALILEHLDGSVRTMDDLRRAVRDLPVLGMIPVVASWKGAAQSHVVSLSEPSSPTAEAYRTLRTSIRFMAVDQPFKIIQVTSPRAGEGKTTTSANLAVALARAGDRVVVVSCDLRRPRLHEFFGLSNKVGFTSVLLGETPLSAALQQVTQSDNPNDATNDRLWLLASGPLPPNPSELLSSARASEVLAGLRAYADTIVVDCPPVLPVTDAAVLSAKVDGTLLVVSAGATMGKQLTRCVEMLRQVGAPLVGAVLNNAPTDTAYGYDYAYYAPDPRPTRPSGAGAGKPNGHEAREATKAAAPSRGKR